MTEFTAPEKELILQAFDIMFKAGAVRGDLAYMAQVIGLAQSVEQKLQARAIDTGTGDSSSLEKPRQPGRDAAT